MNNNENKNENIDSNDDTLSTRSSSSINNHSDNDDDDEEDDGIATDTSKTSLNRRKQHKPKRVNNNELVSLNPKRVKKELVEDGERRNTEDDDDYDDITSKRDDEIAYCTLCKKEFCNKYFLKSHMANKHGGLFEPTSTVYLGSQGSMMTHFKYVSPKKHLLNQHSEDIQQNLKINDTNHESKAEALLIKQSLSHPPIDIPSTNGNYISSNEDYCDLCQKHFCNKYYLRKHKFDVHGIQIDNNIKPYKKHDKTSQLKFKSIDEQQTTKPRSSTPQLSAPIVHLSSPPSPIAKTILTPTQEPLNLSQSHQQIPPTVPNNLMLLNPYFMQFPSFFNNPFTKPIELMPTPPLPLTQPKKQQEQQPDSTNEYVNCHLCSKSFRNLDFLKLHLTNKHSQSQQQLQQIENNGKQVRYELKLDNNSDSMCFICEKDFTNKKDLKQHLIQKHSSHLNDTEMQLNELDLTNGKCLDKVTCDICNKQLCNKYFLRTHKAKVHGKDIKLLQDDFDDQNQQEKEQVKDVDISLQMQPFYIDSKDKQFSDYFIPCLVYLPVKTKLNQSICLELQLKPFDKNKTQQQEDTVDDDKNLNEQAIDYSLKKSLNP